VDTPTLPVTIDTQAYRADGILGSMLIRGQIALLLNIDRLLKIWERATALPRLALPAGRASGSSWSRTPSSFAS